jgi:hypothetical protein
MSSLCFMHYIREEVEWQNDGEPKWSVFTHKLLTPMMDVLRWVLCSALQPKTPRARSILQCDQSFTLNAGYVAHSLRMSSATGKITFPQINGVNWLSRSCCLGTLPVACFLLEPFAISFSDSSSNLSLVSYMLTWWLSSVIHEGMWG